MCGCATSGHHSKWVAVETDNLDVTFADVLTKVITNITGGWAYSVFGFISIPMLAVPFFLFKFGHRLRTKSKHAAHVDMKTQLMKDQAPTETHMMGGMQSMA